MSEASFPISPLELNHAGLIELARSLPKIDTADPRCEVLTSKHTQYRDNFFKRFIDMRAVTEGKASEAQVTYMKMVKERFALDLLEFYSQNHPLCSAICCALDEKQPYDELVNGFKQLQESEAAGEIPIGNSDELNAATAHPLGIEAIGIYYWDQINPLLEQAYSIIDTMTLNAPYLARS